MFHGTDRHRSSPGSPAAGAGHGDQHRLTGTAAAANGSRRSPPGLAMLGHDDLQRIRLVRAHGGEQLPDGDRPWRQPSRSKAGCGPWTQVWPYTEALHRGGRRDGAQERNEAFPDQRLADLYFLRALVPGLDQVPVPDRLCRGAVGARWPMGPDFRGMMARSSDRGLDRVFPTMSRSWRLSARADHVRAV